MTERCSLSSHPARAEAVQSLPRRTSSAVTPGPAVRSRERTEPCRDCTSAPPPPPPQRAGRERAAGSGLGPAGEPLLQTAPGCCFLLSRALSEGILQSLACAHSSWASHIPLVKHAEDFPRKKNQPRHITWQTVTSANAHE